MTPTTIRIGTRGSPLAMWQAELVAARLRASHPNLHLEIIAIKTTGDRVLETALAPIGGKGLFVKEIEEALCERRVDIAVHSMKDVPSILPEGLVMGAILPRDDYRDALVSNGVAFKDLPEGACIGTTSLRRRAEAAKRRPDLRFELCRGNVGTRLRKLADRDYDAIILSASGLIRLGFSGVISEYLDWIPAAGQGIIGVECRQGDHETSAYLASLNDPTTAIALRAERAFMRELEGNCQVALGCLAEQGAEGLLVRGFWIDPETGAYREGKCSGDPESAESLGLRLAQSLR